ncbi:MAG: bifunctional adenosylcobinamide kinase/adenosylcobinamide-phosphate guanylyltransferase [Candidatus Ozemobacteraceae bacterium]
MAEVTLITGGTRSGKSRHALNFAQASGIRAPVFVATAEAFDEEMKRRIEKHRNERPSGMLTIEVPVDLATSLRRLPPGTDLVIVDCLTVWMSNLMHYLGPDKNEYLPVRELLQLLKEPPCDLVFVTNEVGLGIVPENAMARRFRDLAGELNCAVAARADRVLFMVCGFPMTVKAPA